MEAHQLTTITEEPQPLPQPNPKKVLEPAILVIENVVKAKPSNNNRELSSLSKLSIERKKSISRQQFLLQKKAEIGTQLANYTKVKNRWAKAEATVKIFGTSLVLVSSIFSCFFRRNCRATSCCNTFRNCSSSSRANRRSDDFIHNKTQKVLFVLRTFTLEEMEQFYLLIEEYHSALS